MRNSTSRRFSCAVVLLLAIIGGVVWFFFIREVPVDKTKLLPWEPPENVAEERIYDLFPQLIINPVDSRGRFFLILKINILFQDIDILPELLDKPWILPKAQNIVIDIFSTYTMGELRMPKFKEEARQEIKSEFNALLGWTEAAAALTEEEVPPPIKDIYFERYILQ